VGLRRPAGEVKMSTVSKAAAASGAAGQGRSSRREALVLRVGIITDAARTSFCLVKNISPTGVQVKLYGRAAVGSDVMIRVGDEKAIAGRVVWTDDRLAGIEFLERLEPESLLRATQKLPTFRRRSSPRVNTTAQVLIRMGGKQCAAALCDVSVLGARVQLNKLLEVGPAVMISLPDLPSVRAFVRWQDGRELGLSFEPPFPIEILTRCLDGQLNVSG
jgi:hypothetical protein